MQYILISVPSLHSSLICPTSPLSQIKSLSISSSEKKKTDFQEISNRTKKMYSKNSQKPFYWGKTREPNRRKSLESRQKSKRDTFVSIFRRLTKTPRCQPSHRSREPGVELVVTELPFDVFESMQGLPCCLSESCSLGLLYPLCLLQYFFTLFLLVPWSLKGGTLRRTYSLGAIFA